MADYLKKYLSSGTDEKKRKKLKKRSNLAIHDDDVDWRATAPKYNVEVSEDEDIDSAPVVASVKDESVVKWLPVAITDDSSSIKDMSTSRRGKTHLTESPDLSPVRNPQLDSPDSGEWHLLSMNSRPILKPRLDSPDISPVRKPRLDTPERSPPRSYLDKEATQSEFDRKLARPRIIRRPKSPDVVEVCHSQTTKSEEKCDTVVQQMNACTTPRKHRHYRYLTDLSLHKSDSGLGPSSVCHDTDLSPPRKRKMIESPDLSQSLHGHTSKEIVMSSGAKAGLQSAQLLREENAFLRKQQKNLIQDMDHAMSGRHADTVYRDKHGKKIDQTQEMIKQREKAKKQEEEDQKFMEWGRGITQTKSAKEKLADDLYEMSKPLARYADDEDLEKMLKDREREGDPMLAFIKSKAKVSKEKSSKNRKLKKEKPSYKGSIPANRFGIRPGYRWDGVNRSNGFEKTWFHRQSNQKAVSDEAYKWSVEDM